MAAPLKPWERTGVNFQSEGPLPVNSMAGMLGADSVAGTALGGLASPAASSAPPQVPPRPSQQSSLASRYGSGVGGYGSYGGYSGYSSPYGGAMGGGMGGYGGGLYSSPYSSYGGMSNYGGGYGANRFNDPGSSTFARQAEESSRSAFESIETIVHAVNSVGMMLDSTFQAVYNSFRAVIGVADNFSRLKSQLVQVFSALAFLRTLRYLYRRLLEVLRLRPEGEAAFEWSKAFKEASAMAPPSGPRKSSWPILLFGAFVMGGPYLIWRLISAFSGSSSSSEGWAQGKEDHFVARANFGFEGQGTEELSFAGGQTITVAPKELQPRVRGWLLASVDGQRVGMIPANHVTVLGKRRGTQQGQASSAPPTIPDNNSTPGQFEDAFSAGPQAASVASAVGQSDIPDAEREASDILNDIDPNS